MQETRRPADTADAALLAAADHIERHGILYGLACADYSGDAEAEGLPVPCSVTGAVRLVCGAPPWGEPEAPPVHVAVALARIAAATWPERARLGGAGPEDIAAGHYADTAGLTAWSDEYADSVPMFDERDSVTGFAVREGGNVAKVAAVLRSLARVSLEVVLPTGDVLVKRDRDGKRTNHPPLGGRASWARLLAMYANQTTQAHGQADFTGAVFRAVLFEDVPPPEPITAVLATLTISEGEPDE